MGNRRTLSESVCRFLAWLKPRVKPNTVSWYQHFLKRFVAGQAVDELRAVRRLDIESFSAAHHPLVAVTRFFRWAKHTAGWIRRDPGARVKIPKNGRRKRTLTPRERTILRWLARSDRRRRPLALAMLVLEYTACRPGEMRSLRWECLRGPAGGRRPDDATLASGHCWFELHEFKGAERRRDGVETRIITIPPRVGRALVRLRKRSPADVSGYILRGASGRAWSANGFRCAWRRFRERLAACGLVDVAGLVPYLYRHSKATELARLGYNTRLIADYLGHAGLEMVSVYVHSNCNDLTAMARGER